MTKITYLSHSGFIATLDNVILVFDYDHDPAHALEHTLKANAGKPVVFFVSHNKKNRNHPQIFERAQNHRCVYVMSNDVPAKEIPSTLDVAGMSAGDVLDRLPGDIMVKAYGSTDKGVSFLVTEKDGTKIFHGGDLNNWEWIDENTERDMAKAKAEFEKIVNRIASENSEIDTVFFPVDQRLGGDAGDGAAYFMSKIKVANFFPMHIEGKADEACDFAKYVPAGTEAYCLSRPGESVKLETEHA